MYHKLLSFILFIFVVPTARAQQEMPSGSLPDSIVVTANRYPMPQRDAAQRITVWDALDIQSMAVHSFDELLRAVGGVEVFSRSGFGIQSDITMRGSTFNGVLLLVDGIPLNDAMTGHFITDLPIPISDIARIEVMRGPAAMAYGPDAMGGVIHIMTHAAAASPPTEPGVEGGLGASTGSHGHNEYRGDAVYQSPRWSIGGASVFQQSDGETISNADGPVEGPDGLVKTDFSRSAHTLYQSFRFSGFDAYLRLAMDRRDFNAYHFYTISALDFSREKTETYWAHLRLKSIPTHSLQWQAHASWKRHEDWFLFNPSFSANEHTSQHLTAQFHLNHRISTRWQLVTGVNAGTRSIDSNNLGNHEDNKAGFFALNQFEINDQIRINAGSRIDYDSGFGVEVSPQANLLFKSGAWALRANMGRSVRAPNYVERYINTVAPPSRGRNYGNPDLESERAWSYEGGADFYPSAGISFHATAFHRRTSNLIDFAQRAPTSTPMLADSVLLALNIVEVNLDGIEIDAVLTQTVGRNSFWDLSATYTRLHSTLEGKWPDATFKYASGHARNLIQAMSSLRHRGASIGIHYLWKEKLDASSYAVVNLRASYQAFSGSVPVTFSLDLRNIFDRAYTEVLDAPLPGRWLVFGAHIKFRR